MTSYPTLPQRMWNMRPWRRNPLMSAGYRLESLVQTVLVALLMAAVVVAIALGTAMYRHDITAATDVDARQVPAVLDADPHDQSGPFDFGAAPAHWVVDGRTHTATIRLDSSAGRGDRVTIWVDKSGDRTATPPSRAQAIPDGVGVAVLAYSAMVACVLVVRRAFRLVVDRVRAKQWELRWEELADSRKWNRL